MADNTERTEPRIASHPDDPSASLADRLILALGMWPSYVDELGAETVIEAAVLIRNQAHRFPMAAEDYGTAMDEIFALRTMCTEAADTLDELSVDGPGELVARLREAADGFPEDDDDDEGAA